MRDLRCWLGGVTAVLLSPALALAAGDGPLVVEPWSVVPFAGLLLAIAGLPLVAEHWWHSNRNRALVSVLFALPVVGYLLYLEIGEHQAGLAALWHGLQHYLQFIALLWALYTVAGGMVVDLHIKATPWANTILLALGAALANLIGTTGASMLLIRPFLRINHHRKQKAHLPIFFIFTVSNMGGLLTPLGDPPLFLGFLAGVEFTWTLQLYPQWLVGNGIVLGIFLVWDTWRTRQEVTGGGKVGKGANGSARAVRVRGLVNVLLLAGVLVAVLLQAAELSEKVAAYLRLVVPVSDLTLRWPMAELLMVLMGVLSLWLTPRGLRAANNFSWGAMVEVIVVFLGIFITMVPALALLTALGRPGADSPFLLTQPFQYFWLTGILSAFLDNAPTYVAFATMAAGQEQYARLMVEQPAILAAISCGAVFMGAMTYIGNGPNFMVKAIAEENGYRMPSFFGYLGYSAAILLPVFVLMSLLYFPPSLLSR